MGEWKTVRLGQLFSRVSRRNFENNTNVLTASANYGLINQQEFFNKIVASNNLSNYYLLYKGEFVYNKSYCDGYPMGAFKRLDMYDKGIVTTLYICFAVASDQVCSDFYLHLFESGLLNDELNAIAQEGARNHGLLNVGVDKFFNNIRVPFPDLPDQYRIAAVLNAADEAIASSRALVEKYAAVKRGLMQDLLGHGEKVSLKKLGGRFIRGHGITRADVKGDGVPCIRYGELYTTYNIWLDKPVSHVSEELARQCFHIKYGDLLFTLSGETAEEIGKTVVYLGEEEAVVGGDLAVFTGHKQNPLYLSYILNAPDALKQKELRATGSMVVHINSKKIEEVSVPLPPLPEQERIVEILTAADERLTAERERLRKLENIKRGLMDDLLTNRASTDKLQGGV